MSKREKATKVKSYTGILNEPMPLPRETILGPTLEEQTAQNLEPFLRRIVALFNLYGIDPKTDNAWMSLAVALAHNHVPGFQYGERKPGAPYKRAGDDVTLYFEVKRLIAEGKSINSACHIIEKRGVLEDLKACSIRQRYYDYTKEGKIGWHIDRIEEQIGKERFREVISTPLGEL